MHIKNFDNWNLRKKEIHKILCKHIPKKREIWWMAVGENIGDEENGKNFMFERPVLVLKVFNKRMFIGIPMTSASKNKKSFYYVETKYKNRSYFYILPQIRLFSTKRLLRIIRKIEQDEFISLKKSLSKILGLKDV